MNDGGSGFAPLGLMSSSNSLAAMMNGGMMKAGGEWREEEKRVLESLAAPRDGGDEVCLEKRVFYRLISGPISFDHQLLFRSFADVVEVN